MAKKTPPKPPVIGLTGGIAAGKTTVAKFLAEKGAFVIDADRIGHKVISPEGEAYPDVVAAFGTEILADDGSIDRSRLGPLVFSDPGKLARLNSISHPRMAKHMAKIIKQIRATGREAVPPMVVLDAAILFEAEWDSLCDEVWTVETPPEVAVSRLVSRNRMSGEQARERIEAQLSNEQRANRASRVIRTTGTLKALESPMETLWREFEDEK